MESRGTAYWKMIYKADKGENVVQTLPSGIVDDLTGAITTPIMINCCFFSRSGEYEMVRMGSCSITPHHHILTEDGWATARQAADRGQGEILANYNIPRVYNLCLEGGGNIFINTSSLPGLTTLTTAATMGYRFEPATNPQQMGSLTYPADVQTRLGLRQDLRAGRTTFFPDDVQTLPNGELIFKNTTGVIVVKQRPGTGSMPSQLPTPSMNNSPAAIRLAPIEPKMATTLDKPVISGESDQDNLDESNPTYLDTASSRCLSAEIRSDQACLASRKSHPKSDMANAASKLKIHYEPANKNPHSPNSFHADITTSPHFCWKRFNGIKLRPRTTGLHPASHPTHVS